jgi:hypothetical protein
MEMGKQLDVRTSVFLEKLCPAPTGYEDEGAWWVSTTGQRSEIRMIVVIVMITAFQIMSLNYRGLCSSKEKHASALQE